MGHYDSCYDADKKEEAERENDEIESEIRHSLYSLSFEEKKFLLLIIKNIDVIKSFKEFLKDLK